MILQAVRVGTIQACSARKFSSANNDSHASRVQAIHLLCEFSERKREGNFLAQKGNPGSSRSRSRFHPGPSRIRPLLEIPVLVIHKHLRNLFRSKWQFVVSAHRDDTSFARHDLVEPSSILQLDRNHLVPGTSLLFVSQGAERLRRQRYHALHISSKRFEFEFLRGLNESRVSNYGDDSKFSLLLKLKSRQGLQIGTLVYRTSVSTSSVQICFSFRKARISISAPQVWSRQTSPSRRPCQPSAPEARGAGLLAVFDPLFNIQVRRRDKRAQFLAIDTRPRRQLHMSHPLPAALQQLLRIR